MNKPFPTELLSGAGAQSRPKPVYLLAGGPSRKRMSHDALIQEMLKETDFCAPSVAYVGTASDDNPQFFKTIRSLLLQNGAGQVNLVPLASPDCDLPAARSLIESSNVVFFSGGDVEYGMQLLCERGVLELFHQRFRAGAVLAGLSAGSILLCQQWLKWRVPEDDSSAELFNCLGVIPLVCDMHDEEDGWQELKTLLHLRHVEGEVGYGIPASMGLRIRPDLRIEDMGGRAHRFIFRKGRVESVDGKP